MFNIYLSIGQITSTQVTTDIENKHVIMINTSIDNLVVHKYSSNIGNNEKIIIEIIEHK